MTPERLFGLCNNLALVAWIFLVVLFPLWRGARLLVNSCAVSLLLAAVYLALAPGHLFKGGGDIFTVAGISAAFQDPWIVVIGWIHYLAFDLFIGGWEARDARALGIPHIAIIPSLLLTFVLGPVGLLSYFILRWALRRRFLVGEGERAVSGASD